MWQTTLLHRVLLCSILCLSMIGSSTQASEKVEQELITRISKSKAALSTIEASIAKERSRYASKLNAEQQKTKKLRTEAAALQRLTDEQLLGLEQLQTRVDLWSTQSNYQRHLFSSYIEAISLPTTGFEVVNGAPEIDARTLPLALAHIESLLKPSWREQEIVSKDGTLVKISVLNTGPIQVAYDAASNSGGLISREVIDEPQILDIYSSADLTELASLQIDGNGYLSFDPTLGNALQIRNGEDSLFTHLKKGGVWAMPILFFGFLSFIISVTKGWQFFRLPAIDTNLIDKINHLVAELRNDPSKAAELKPQLKLLVSHASAAQQKLIQISMSWPVSQQRDDLLVAYLMEYKHKLERYMGIVATSAAIAPLLGLLGTVSGMISTFKMMTIFGSGDAATVSGGISEALVTTELGLIVAIPSLLVSALLTRRVKSYSHLLESFAIKLSKIRFSL